MNAVAIINLAGVLVGTLGPMSIDLAMKIKALIEAAKLGSVDIKKVGAETIAADDATMDTINKWLVDNNLPPMTKG